MRTLIHDGLAAFVGLGRGLWLLPLDVMFRTVGLRYGWLVRLFSSAPPPVLRAISQLRAERAAWRATRRVPAYADYLAADRRRTSPGCSRSGSCATSRRPTRRRTSIAIRCSSAASMATVPFAGHDHRRVERLDRDAVQLDPRPTRARGRPSQHRVLRALRVRDGATGDDQRVLDGRLGGRLQHEPRDAAPWRRQVDRARPRQDPVDPRGPRAALPLPHLRLSAVPQAPARRGRAPRLPVRRLRAPRPRRRRGHDRGAARPAAPALRLGLLGLRRDRHRDRHGRRVAGQRRPPSARPGAARHPARAVRHGPAPADGLPVQPADPLHGGQRPARGHLHGVAASTSSRRGSATTSTTPAGSSTSSGSRPSCRPTAST